MKKLTLVFCLVVCISQLQAQEVYTGGGTSSGATLTWANTNSVVLRNSSGTELGTIAAPITVGGTITGNTYTVNSPTNPLYTRSVTYLSTNVIGVYNGGVLGTTATTSGNVYSTFTNTLPTGVGYSGHWWLTHAMWSGGTNCPIDIFLFDSLVTAVSDAAQGSAWTYRADTDGPHRMCPVLSLTSATSMGTSYGFAVGGLNYPLIPLDGSNVYGVVISRGAVTNRLAAEIASSTNYSISFGLIRD